MNDFLPNSYDVPQKAGNYMKFQDGENKFRFLSSPILGWEGWKDMGDGTRKPIRHKMNEPFDPSEVEPESIKHFWASVVWNYKDKKIQILEITQKSIQKTLRALANNEDWGSPLHYDILVVKSGQKLETEYQVNPIPPRDLDESIVKEYKQSNIDLNKLYTGEDPFAVTSSNEAINLDDIPDDL